MAITLCTFAETSEKHRELSTDFHQIFPTLPDKGFREAESYT